MGTRSPHQHQSGVRGGRGGVGGGGSGRCSSARASAPASVPSVVLSAGWDLGGGSGVRRR